MKSFVLVCIAIMLGTAAFAQSSVNHDPTYSIHNYKHPNKVAYARIHNLDRHTQLPMVSVRINGDYKQPHNNGESVSGGFEPRTMDRSTKSYKHPMGL